MEINYGPKQSSNWCFIAFDYNKRKEESKEIAQKVQQQWAKK